jgi:hypothetical protein
MDGSAYVVRVAGGGEKRKPNFEEEGALEAN